MKQLSIPVTRTHADSLCDLLLAKGALSASVVDADLDTPEEKPVFIEPDWIDTVFWPNCIVEALMEDSCNEKQWVVEICKALNLKKTPSYHCTPLIEKDWVRESLRDFKPLNIGKKLVLVPSWAKTRSKNRIKISFDPGLAFGTGKHPTTFMCLEWLEKSIQGSEKVLDFGCGSGILALCAKKLGASVVSAVDIDPQALQSTRDNAQKNELHLEVALPEKLRRKSFDIVVANILANPLMYLAQTIQRHLSQGGKIALSGILSDQADAVQKIYSQWFTMGKIRIRDNWALLTGVKK